MNFPQKLKNQKFKETQVGRIPEDWEIRPLTELISHVVDNRGKTAPTSNDGIALIATNCIKEDGLYPIKEKIRYVAQETYDNWFRDHPKTGDIIIVNKGTPGLVCLVPEKVDFCIAQDMVAIRPKDTYVYGKYLFTAMRSKNFKFQVDGLNVGTTIPHLKKTVFSKLLIPVPPKEDQIFIGNTYCSLSEKIELNRSMNSTLEAIGQALFKHWFVDFEFPNEEGKPYRSSGGEMVETELGEVPGGWRLMIVGDVLELAYGKALKDENRCQGKIPVYGSNGQIGWHDEKLVDGPGIIVGRKGNPGIVIWSHTAFFPIDTTFYVVPKAILSKYYIFYVLRLQNLPSLGADSAVPGLNRNVVYMNKMVVPSSKILELFDAVIRKIFDKVQANNEQSGTITSIRDALLPKLMSGEIRVNLG